uniref:Uncharacterized protein n=1 Tax=Rhizophora mucronata TaxID=61149 RepID=A0A2P2PRV1_RHIMU
MSSIKSELIKSTIGSKMQQI